MRDIKPKIYPKWRIDTYFSKYKYSNVIFVSDGGWHFSFLQSPEDIAKKIKSYSHGEFNTEHNTNEEMINKKIKENIDIFDRGFKLSKINIDSSFPSYIVNNQKLLKDWII